ncbi:ankyrin repeat-containing protein [Colletotrichum chrysophilum]|uniref:Ankyrin repeat-containing protein n=1 Tax=Colletotrichum chrysophilum TaxID=1836956 RepID=A0AAD9AGY1_9PEZI|nr:ankyrin repeat-containing protein [Colletotrichum chrysophilum]
MAGPTASNSDDAEGRAMELQVTLKGDNFWASAMKRLAEHDVSQLLKAVGPQGNHDATLRGLLDAINSRKRECMKKRWKVTIKDRTIILRDILEKISVWVSKVIKIGDVAVQYDPVSAALPWAAVRLVMQASVNDVEVFGFVLESVESITNVIATCTIFELQLWDLSKLAEAEKANSILVSMNQLALQNTSETSFQKRQISDLQQILKELAEPISRVSSGIEAIQDGLHRTERLQILKAISNIPYRLHHKTARNDRLKGSGQWLLKKRAFRMWRAESSSSVLWLHGIPGSGKTKLASLVIDELEQSETVAFFYCMRNPAEPQRGQASKVLASLVRQLSIVGSSSIILPPVVAKYDEALSGFAEFHDVAWSLDECQEVFLELMEYHPSVTVIIDALDEINQEDRQGLLDSLSRLLDESPNLLKIFLSSRDNHDISLRLTGSPNIYIEADDNDDDVTAFM